MQYDVGGWRPQHAGRRRDRATVRGTGGRLVPWVLKVGALDFGFEQFMVVPILPAVECRVGRCFAAGSLVCALSGSLAGLVAGRVPQGMRSPSAPLRSGARGFDCGSGTA